ncbi:MAG TPA: hypothetical protein VIF61_00350 [Methylocystis sp.]|jgi:hypothetical protein
MSALTASRATLSEDGVRRRFPVKGGVLIFQGALVVLAAGLAKPGVAAAGLIALGRAEETVDASTAADGDLFVNVSRGLFKWENSAGDALTLADVGANAYILDDQTVAKTATDRSSAGLVHQVESDGVWVRTP